MVRVAYAKTQMDLSSRRREEGAFEFSKTELPYHWCTLDYSLPFFRAKSTVLTSLFLHDTATEGAEERFQDNQREDSVFRIYVHPLIHKLSPFPHSFHQTAFPSSQPCLSQPISRNPSKRTMDASFRRT